MTPFSILTDPSTGDIDVSRGIRFTPDLQTYVVQRLDENLSFFLGEWFLDSREGLPYWQKIIGAKPDVGLLDTIFRRGILATTGVGSVPNLKIDFDRATRTASPRFKAVLQDGTTVSEADLGRPFLVDT